MKKAGLHPIKEIELLHCIFDLFIVIDKKIYEMAFYLFIYTAIVDSVFKNWRAYKLSIEDLTLWKFNSWAGYDLESICLHPFSPSVIEYYERKKIHLFVTVRHKINVRHKQSINNASIKVHLIDTEDPFVRSTRVLELFKLYDMPVSYMFSPTKFVLNRKIHWIKTTTLGS